MSSRTLLGCIELGLLAGIAVLTFAATAGSQAATGVSRFAADPPAPPGKPVVLEKGLNTLSVTWTALDEAVGDATSHDFEYRQGTSGDWIAGPQGLRGTRAEIGSLATDTDYQVRMRARNAAGGGKADRCADACGGGDSGTRHLPQLLRQGSAGVGLLRGIGQSGRGGEVSIEAIDDRGTSAGTVMLTIGADAVAHFNSADLEQGNPAKGLSGGVGSGKGDWRLIVDSELEFEVLSYVRTADGFLTSMHDTAPKSDDVYEVAIFNPGSNPNQLSRLRLINLDAEEAEVTITGVDDAGASPGAVVEIVVPGGESVTLTSAELEAGTSVAGALGDGSGKWRLLVRSDQPILVMNLLSSPSGHLTNLSTAPGRSRDGALGRSQ